MLTWLTGCAPTQPNELDKLGTTRITIKNKAFELWIADEDDERLRGLMFINAEQMAPLSDGTERGMIFLFNYSGRGSFWMKNTIIPLDIAYITTEGVVDKIYTMAALDDRSNQYPPDNPYRITIELNAGSMAKLGLKKGDVIKIPAELLKNAQ